MDLNIKKTLIEIFGLESSWIDGFERRYKLCPGFDDIYSYAEVLSNAEKEEDLQKYLACNPKFLLGAIGSGGDSDFAFIPKPSIGSHYKADFATLTIGQGGGAINMIELETPNTNLFTKQGTPSKVLQKAISQVTNWKAWISKSKITYVPDLLTHVKKLPLYPETSSNKSFQLSSPEKSEMIWKEFGGYDHPIFIYTIIIGRWSKLRNDEKERLTFNNSQENSFFQIMTYEQLARRAYDRPLLFF